MIEGFVLTLALMSILYWVIIRNRKICIKREILLMKVRVKLFVAGQVFTEEVRAADYNEAKQVALARNPNATVVSVTRAF